jgi:tRNA (mo5U34)-methyltransferase
MERTEIQRRVDAVPAWFHSIEVAPGITTPGLKSAELLRSELPLMRLPPLGGKSVLDIGAWDGFYSFAAERQGAAKVVALDHYMWGLEQGGHTRYWQECRQKGIAPLPYEQTENWHPDTLPGKLGFDTAHELLGSKVEAVAEEFMTMELSTLGTFDIVLFLGVLYHMEHPMDALKRLAKVTSELAIIETEAADFLGMTKAACRFLDMGELNSDSSNWWVPNAQAVVAMCRRAGFSRVEVLTTPPAHNPKRFARRVVRGASSEPQHYRLVAHAWM